MLASIRQIAHRSLTYTKNLSETFSNVGEDWRSWTQPLKGKDHGANRGRTGDLMNAIHALYQLSYSPIKIHYIKRLIK